MLAHAEQPNSDFIPRTHRGGAECTTPGGMFMHCAGVGESSKCQALLTAGEVNPFVAA